MVAELCSILVERNPNIFAGNRSSEHKGDNCFVVAIVCSIGSLGKDGSYDVAENIRVKNCIFTETENGVRIKTWEV